MRFWMRFKFISLIGLFCALAACSPQQAAAEGEKFPLIIRSSSGAQMFSVEVADTPEESERGLMYRKELATDHGMLFIFPKTQPAVFWMKNTYIPLDMVFIREDGTVAHIHKNAIPLDETGIPSTEPVKAILEIYAGQADKRNIQVGDHVETTLLKQGKQ